MRRQPVESSAIASVGYDAATAALEIEFVNGSCYRYYAVPPSVHRRLMEAESTGRAFAELIRERYPTEQID